MATGFGIDPTYNGSTLVSGTDSKDIRQITEALYSPGVIKGGQVSLRSDMRYAVSAGVACVKMATGENTLIPIPATTTGIVTSPTSTRTDKIYAKQNNPATDGTSTVIVGVTSGTLPTGSVLLGSYSLPAGAVRTSQASETGNIDYSIPYGTGGQILYRYHDKSNGYISANPKVVSGKFYLPTDRLVTFSILSAVDMDSQGEDAALYQILHVDGTKITTFSTGRLYYTRVESHFWQYTMVLEQGDHTVSFTRDPVGSDAAKVRLLYSPTGSPGNMYTVIDSGVVK